MILSIPPIRRREQKQGIVLAGGNGQGNSLRQLIFSKGLFNNIFDRNKNCRVQKTLKLITKHS